MWWDSFEDILHILKVETIAYEPFMDYSLVVKGLVSLNEAMSNAMQGHPRWMGHGEGSWQNGLLREERTNGYK